MKMSTIGYLVLIISISIQIANLYGGFDIIVMLSSLILISIAIALIIVGHSWGADDEKD